ncbi:MAG TPA: hypothetical protein HPP77_00530 [Candidatus Hydrogenedentes bacterium]|nr:hypothetical protein [Candidatus Hydrogenedentota bacterium]
MAQYEYTMGKDVDLKAEQARTLETPAMSANLLLRTMYLGMDLIYGFKRTLPKFKVIELLARYPYWAWENGAYNRLTRSYARTRGADKKGSDLAVRHIELGRKSQDNEQWHLMLIEDIMRQKGIRQGWIKACFLPRVMAFKYLVLTRLMYRLKPEWSFAMNARFESHAEHEYMRLVQEHPEWEDEPAESEYFQYYPRQATLADLFRRIGLDERDHMHESMEEYERLTGRSLASS